MTPPLRRGRPPVPGIRINVGCGDAPASGWLNLDLTNPAADRLYDITQGLPDDIEEPIDRIYAGHVFEHLPHDDLFDVLELWRAHPQVSTNTLLAITGPDCDKADRLLRERKLSKEDHTLIVEGAGNLHLWRSTGKETARIVRDAGWGIAQPYNLEYLVMDRWPVTSQVEWQFGALCRAIK